MIKLKTILYKLAQVSFWGVTCPCEKIWVKLGDYSEGLIFLYTRGRNNTFKSYPNIMHNLIKMYLNKDEALI